MGIYAIHAPEPVQGSHGLEQVRAVKSGFSPGALILGPFWLLARGLWLALIGYVVAAAIIVVLASSEILSSGAAFALFALGALYLGFAGHALRADALSRAGRPVADVLLEDGAARAERAYLVSAIARSSAATAARTGVTQRGDPGIVGLFPQRGR